MPRLLHTDPGNVASFWQPWKTKAATFWQRCQLLATLPRDGAFPPIGLGSDSYPAAPTRSEPTWTSCSTHSRPSAHCQLPPAFCLLPTAHCPLPLRRSAQDRAKRPPPCPPSQGGERGVAAARVQKLFQNGDWPICLVGPVSKRGLAHLPCRACPRFETASQRWPELVESVPREKMLSLLG